MKLKYKYILASLPPFLLFGGWKLSDWAYHYYACQGGLKNLQPCYVGTIDIMPYIGFGLSFCQIFWFPAIVFSAWLLLRIKHKDEEINCLNKESKEEI